MKTKSELLLDQCKGPTDQPLDADTKSRLRAVMLSPNQKTWNDAYTLVVGGLTGLTLWKAACYVDASFDPVVPDYDHRGNLIWPRIPDQMHIARSIRFGIDYRDDVEHAVLEEEFTIEGE